MWRHQASQNQGLNANTVHKGAMCHTLATVGMTPLHVLMVEKWAAGFKRAIGGFFSRITRERIGWSTRNLGYPTFSGFGVWNFDPTTMTFDLWNHSQRRSSEVAFGYQWLRLVTSNALLFSTKALAPLEAKRQCVWRYHPPAINWRGLPMI